MSCSLCSLSRVVALVLVVVVASMVASVVAQEGDGGMPPLPTPDAPVGGGGGFGGPLPIPPESPAPPRLPTPITPPASGGGSFGGGGGSTGNPATPAVIEPPPSLPVPTPSIPTTSLPTTSLPTTSLPTTFPRASSPTSPTSPPRPSASSLPTLPQISLTPETDPAPRASATKIVGDPPAALLQQRPELVRSVADPQHPFFGLVGPPRSSDTTIQGTPLTLYAVILSTRQPARRLQRIAAYWDATELLAHYHLRCAFETQLHIWTESLQQSSQRTAQNESMLALLAPARQLAACERRVAEVRFIKQQQRLAELLAGGEPTDALPIPCDFPLVKPYDTKIDAIARQRGVSPRAREIDMQLPVEHLLLGHRRDATVAAEEMFRIVYERQTSLIESLVALQQVMTVRQELVAEVLIYNKMIADYVTETVGSEASAYRLLSALVELGPLE